MISPRNRAWLRDLSQLLGAFAVVALVAVNVGATGDRDRDGRRTAASASVPSLSAGANPVAGSAALAVLATLGFVVSRGFRRRRAIGADVLRECETLRVTLASIGDGVLTTDVCGRVLYLNGEAESLTGWTSEEAAGKPVEKVFRIVNEETRRPVENPASRALSEGVVVALASRTVLVARNGVERPIGDIAAPIRDAKGKVAGVVLVFRDVTEERAATDQLHKLATELSEADVRKNDFLALLAHEIRSPLATIRNSVAVLRRADLDPRSSAAAQGAIHRQVEHLARLVEDLLDVSRISRGKLALRRLQVDLRPAIDQAIEATRASFETKEQVLEVELPGAPIPVDADATRITQAVANLLDNASKFTQRAGTIRLSVARENAQVVVRICDNGIGISPEDVPGLFDMFSQVDTRLERAQDGLGIGLHLVKQLVEMHGGLVEARSDGVGCGSEFVIRLPDPAATEAPLLPNPAPEGAFSRGSTALRRAVGNAVAPPRGHCRRILVVDDNADSAESLAMFLRLKGHEAEVAHDGLEAVEVALSTLPDVILLDLGLPKLNGYEAARRIRSSPRGGQIRIIALTGRSQEDDLQQTSSAGFDDHLLKPVDPDRLFALLARSWSAQTPVPALQ